LNLTKKLGYQINNYTKNNICGQFRDVIYKYMVVVTMFVDAISFASGHVVKNKIPNQLHSCKKIFYHYWM